MLPQAPIVADRFHVTKLYRAAVDELRKTELKALKGAPTNSSPPWKTEWISSLTTSSAVHRAAGSYVHFLSGCSSRADTHSMGSLLSKARRRRACRLKSGQSRSRSPYSPSRSPDRECRNVPPPPASFRCLPIPARQAESRAGLDTVHSS
jgi:hypothetical protein